MDKIRKQRLRAQGRKASEKRSIMDLKGRDFLKLLDFTPEEIEYLLDLAADLKDKKKKGIPVDTLRGKNVALIFEKTSTRTRCAFEVAAHDLGMGTTYLDPTGSQIGKKESIADTARVLAGMFEGIEYRGFGQDIVEELAKYSKVPVWNGLTNEFHPTQMLADLLTIREHFGHLKGIRMTYMGDARYNMGNSLMVVCSKLGLDFVACTNKKYFPNGGGSIFTFEIKGDAAKAQEFIDNLELFSLLANVADVKSLVIHPASTTHAQLSEEELNEQGIYSNTIRLSIGTENIDDIIEDLEGGFQSV